LQIDKDVFVVNTLYLIIECGTNGVTFKTEIGRRVSCEVAPEIGTLGSVSALTFPTRILALVLGE